jgi:hypothetical protein
MENKNHLWKLGDKYLSKAEKLMNIRKALDKMGFRKLAKIVEAKKSEAFDLACCTLSMAARMELDEKGP